MASLTDSLPNANPSRRIIDPQTAGPDFLGGLAKFANQALGGALSNIQDGQQIASRNAASTRQAAADALKVRENNALDAAARIWYDARSNVGGDPVVAATPTPTAGGYVPFDSDLAGPPVPPQFAQARDEVVRSQAAENQGRAPTGSSRIVTEAKISELMAAYPDQAYEMSKYFKEAGIEHYLFREFELDEQIKDTEQDTELKAATALAERAYASGQIPAGTDFATAVETGRAQASAEFRLAALKAERDAATAAAAEGRTQTTFNQNLNDRNTVGAAMEYATSSINPLMQVLSQRALEAGLDPTKQTTFQAEIPEFNTTLEVIRANGLAQLTRGGSATPEIINAYNAQFDTYKESVTSYLSGPMSAFEVNERARKSMETTLTITTQQSLPVYTALSQVMGREAVNALFGGALRPNDAAIQAIKREVEGFDGVVDTPGETLQFNQLAGILRGELGIESLTESQARDAIPSLGAVYQANARAIQGDTGNTTAFANSGYQVYNAALQLQPGMQGSDYRQVSQAAAIINGSGAVPAITKMINNPATRDQGMTMVAGGRAAAQHLLNISRSHQLSITETNGGLWSVGKAVDGSFRPEVSRSNYDRWARQQSVAGGGFYGGGGMSVRTVPTFEEVIRRGAPSALREHIGGMNLSINFLMGTSDFDDELPKGLTNNQRRAFYTTGALPEGVTNPAAARAQESASFAERGNEFRQEMAQVRTQSVEQAQPTSTVQQGREVGLEVLTSKGWPEHIAAGIVGNVQAESQFNTSAIGDGGRALSLAQWHPDRQAEARQQGFDLTDIRSAYAFIDWELNNTESAAGRRLRNATNVTEAADVFAQYFLRPKGSETGNADNIHNIRGRRQYAQETMGGRQ